MRAEIKKGRLIGEVVAPPSKSMAHRLLICAMLSDGESVVKNVAYSQDILATLDSITAFGYDIKKDSYTVNIKKGKEKDEIILPCRESGSTLRFFIPLCWTTGKKIKLVGSEKLLSRPMDVYQNVAEKNAFYFQIKEKEIITQGLLKNGVYEIDGSVSSQFITGLAFALTQIEGESTIKIIPPLESKPYVNMTVSAMKKFELGIEYVDDLTIKVTGKKGKAKEVEVEGDYSNSAFLHAFNLIGGEVNVKGLPIDSEQGDRVYLRYFEMIKNSTPTLDVKDCIDLAPILMTMAGIFNGATLVGTERLKIKESDRGVAMAEELAKAGVRVEVLNNEIRVLKSELKKPIIPFYGHNDHRIVMSMAVLCSLVGGEIDGIEAVNKSYPNFFNDIIKLKAKVEIK